MENFSRPCARTMSARLLRKKLTLPIFQSIILSKNNLVAASELTLPIDSKITGIHVRIAPFVLSGSISTPKGKNNRISRHPSNDCIFAGYVIDVLRKEEISGYSNGSFGVVETGFHIIHLNLTTAPSRGVGVWRLKLDNTLAPYNVTVFAYTQLTAQAYLVGKSTGNIFL